MPLARYFIYTGGVLLALLLAIDWYWPQSPKQAVSADVDHPVIHIETQHRWPQAVSFDTSQPTIVPPKPVAEVAPPAPPPPGSPRDAMAMVQEPEPVAKPAKPAAAPKRAVRRTNVARGAAAPRPRVAQYDMFGFPSFFSPSW